jgi:hypothetical protein
MEYLELMVRPAMIADDVWKNRGDLGRGSCERICANRVRAVRIILSMELMRKMSWFTCTGVGYKVV